jgi:hypothetical protein
MKKHLPSFLAGVVTTALVASLAIPALAAYTRNMTVSYSDIKINVNGTTFTPKDVSGRTVEPFSYNGTTYLPVRAVADAVGYNVTWDQSSQTVYLTNGGGSSGGGGYSQGGGATTTVTKLVDTMEPYAYTDMYDYSTYPSTGSKSVSLGGTAYKNAVEIIYGFVSYNLNGRYTTLGGVAGIVDGQTNKDQTLNIYGDGNLLKTIDLPAGGLPVDFSVDVTGVSALKFEGSSWVGIANLELN